MSRFVVESNRPDYKVSIIFVALFLVAMYYTLVGVYGYTVGVSQVSEYELGAVSVKITAPYAPPPRPHQDGVVIVGRDYFTFRFYLTANRDISGVSVYIDAWGTCENYNLSFAPVESGGKYRVEVFLVHPTGETESVDYTVLKKNYMDRDYLVVELGDLKEGYSFDVRVDLTAPDELPEGAENATIVLTNGLQYTDSADGKEYSQFNLVKFITVVRPPVMMYILVTIMAMGGMVALIVAGYIGFFRIFSTTDLVVIAIISAMQTIWVQIIGKPLFFPILNKVPLTYNFAVGDFPYILLLIVAVMLVKKPGTVSLTLFIYNLSSQIMGFYPFNPAWWSYPISEGIIPDLWLLVRGDAILTDKVSFFRRHIELEEFEALPSFKPLKYIDGFIIGFMRGLTMQYFLYTVFLPYFYRLTYNMGYVLYWMVIPWAIGNAIEGAISVPIAEEIKKSVETI